MLEKIFYPKRNWKERCMRISLQDKKENLKTKECTKHAFKFSDKFGIQFLKVFLLLLDDRNIRNIIEIANLFLRKSMKISALRNSLCHVL